MGSGANWDALIDELARAIAREVATELAPRFDAFTRAIVASAAKPPPPRGTTGQAMLTTAEVAEALGITVGTWYAWRSTGRFDDLPQPFGLGKALRYRRADVEAFIARHQAGG